MILGLAHRVGLVADRKSSSREAIEHAERAMDLDELDSNVLGLAGCALSDVGQTSQAIPILENAIDINPLNPQAHAALGTTAMVMRDFPEAVQQLNKGIELSPADRRLSFWYSSLAFSHLMLGDTDKALQAAQTACRSDRKTYLCRVIESAVHLARDDQAKAKDSLNEAMRIKPDLSRSEITRLVGREFSTAIRRLLS